MAAVFFVIAVLLGTFLIVWVPPSQVADEPAHILRAYAIGHGQWVGERHAMPVGENDVRPLAGVWAEPNLLVIGNAMPNGAPYDAVRIASANAQPWTGERRFFPLFTIATYAPTFYLASAKMLAAGEDARLTPYQSILAGRAVNLMLFTLLGTAALLLARRGQAILFCILAVPMTVSLAASFNPDALIIGCSVLAAALLTRESGARLLATLLLALVALAKPPYLPLLAWLLVPVSGRIELRPALLGLGVAAMAALPALLWTAYTTATVATPVVRAAYEAGPLWPGPRPATFVGTDPSAQLQVLRARPSLLVTLPADLLRSPAYFTRGAIGLLAWGTLKFPHLFYAGWSFVFLGALASARWSREALGRISDRSATLILLGGSTALALWAVAMSQYLTWTNVGLTRIEGPQGRYLLPVLPVLALASTGTVDAKRAPLWRRACLWLPVIGVAADLVAVPRLILQTYGGS